MTLYPAVSFPKSGRTWLELMTAHYLAMAAGCDVEHVLKWSQQPHTAEQILAAGLPLIRFSHAHDNALICQRNEFPLSHYRNQHVRLLIRDPRDVLVSQFFNETQRYQRFHGSIDEFARFDCTAADSASKSARYGIHAIVRYLNAWSEHRSSCASFNMLAYEDLRAAPSRCLRSFLASCDITLNDELIADAIEYGSIDNMRRLETTGELNWHGLSGSSSPNGMKVRAGVVGSHKVQLDPDTLAFIEDVLIHDLHPAFERYRTAALPQSAA